MTSPKSSHTPGPWRVKSKASQNIFGGAVSVKVLAGRLDIADVDMLENSDGEANAALIAAAPELLEALRLMVACDPKVIAAKGATRTARAPKADKEYALIKAQAAIAKVQP
jgi:hypothetical protein